MTPRALGRHCASCDKVVTDLSECTREEALARIARAASPCIRMRVDAAGIPIFVGAAVAGALALVPGCDRAIESSVSINDSTSTHPYDELAREVAKAVAEEKAQSLVIHRGEQVLGRMAPVIGGQEAAAIARAEVMRRSGWPAPLSLDIEHVDDAWRIVVRRVARFDASAEPVVNSSESRIVTVSEYGRVTRYQRGG